MRTSLLALLVLTICPVAFAAPTINELSPAAGFPWGGTQVSIQGADLLDEPFRSCYDASPCPITVLFGGVPGDVIDASPGHVLVVAPAHPRGVVDVTIKVAGRADAHRPNAFTFDDLAEEIASGDWTGYFVPVTANDLRGALGSIWRTELTVHNPTGFTVPLDGIFCDTPTPGSCPRMSLVPGETKAITLYPGRGESGTLWVPKGIAKELSMSLRVRDLSRQAEDWGTEVPIVHPDQFAPRVHLLDVPTDPRYRVVLRALADWRTIVRVYPLSGNELLDELDFERPVNGGNVIANPITPAVRDSGHDRVRVTVQFQSGPLDEPPTGSWAFISITNNETQHVTIISPQK
jgi:hypothetical protein